MAGGCSSLLLCWLALIGNSSFSLLFLLQNLEENSLPASWAYFQINLIACLMMPSQELKIAIIFNLTALQKEWKIILVRIFVISILKALHWTQQIFYLREVPLMLLTSLSSASSRFKVKVVIVDAYLRYCLQEITRNLSFYTKTLFMIPSFNDLLFCTTFVEL